MMAKHYLRLALPFLVLTASLAAMAACGGGSEPQDREFDLKIENRKLNLGPAVIKVEQGDAVTLNVDADEHGALHLHGYDIEIDLSPDETATMKFAASATGKFTIMYHPGGEEKHKEGEKGSDEAHKDEGEEIPIASLEVRPR